MWRGPVPAEAAWAVFIKWVAAAKADHVRRVAARKVVRDKPATRSTAAG